MQQNTLCDEFIDASVSPFVVKHGFRSLRPEDGSLFERYINQMPGMLSSYICFSSLLMWEERYQVYWKQQGGYLLLILKGGAGEYWEAIPPLGRYDEEHLLELAKVWRGLERIFQMENQAFLCTEVMEWMIPWIERMGFSHWLEYDLASSDYIYEAEAFRASLENQKTRYNIRYFLQKQEWKFRELNGEDFPLYESVLSQSFCTHHQCEECISGCQIRALKCMVEKHEQLGVRGGLAFVEDRPAGYVGVARVRDVLIYQALKHVYGIRGLAEWMRKTALERWGEGICFINYTEDMGQEGLRKHKQNLCMYKLSHSYHGRISTL